MLRALVFAILVVRVATALGAPSAARPVDPGVRGGPPSPGGALPGRGGRHWSCAQWARTDYRHGGRDAGALLNRLSHCGFSMRRGWWWWSEVTTRRGGVREQDRIATAA